MNVLLICCCLALSSLGLFSQPLPPGELAAALGIDPPLAASLRPVGHYHNARTGLRHSYWQQHWHGIPVHNAIAGLHLRPDGGAAYRYARLFPQPPLPPAILSRSQALAALRALGEMPPDTLSLAWLPDTLGALQLVWQATLSGAAPPYLIQLSLSATGGTVLARRPLSVSCSPAETPLPAMLGPAPQGISLHRQPARGRYAAGLAHRSAGALGGAPSGGLRPPPLRIARPGQMPPGWRSVAAPHEAAPLSPPPVGQYRCLPWPIESPIDGPFATLPAADLVDLVASPDGWHQINTFSFTHTQGNNAYAYFAANGPSTAPAPAPIVRNMDTGVYISGNVPSGGSALNFNFNQSLNTTNGRDFLEMALVNAFVSANRMHDLLFHYGFDEASGNFQSHNFTNQGAAGDEVWVEVQRNGNNMAFFSCPSDGGNPRMRLHLWGSPMPDSILDSAFDNLVVAHEYTHGLIFRLVGGPNVVTCMDGHEQGSEGYCDVVGMLVTLADRNADGILSPNVVGEGIRSIGGFINGDADLGGQGLRRYPYAVSIALNPITYDSVPQLTAPHQVGFAWGSMLWDIVWDLIDAYGYSTDLYDPNGTAGNVRALNLIVESLRYLACDPTFIDMRDALLQADATLYGGALAERLWTCFARRGLGYSAQAGGMAAYDMPPMAPLPVSWLYFNAAPEPLGIGLHWATATEDQNAGFAIERLPEGAVAPADVGWVPAAPNADEGSRYYFLDKNVVPGVTYLYRLRQKDINDAESYSPWQSARWQGGEESLLLWPNPATDVAHFKWTANQGAASLKVVDPEGKVRLSRRLQAGETAILDLSHWPSGWLTVWIESVHRHSAYRLLRISNDHR